MQTLGGDEAEAGVAKLEALPAGRNAIGRCRFGRNAEGFGGDVVRADVLDDDGRSERIGAEVGGVHHGEAAAGGKPESSVRGAASGRLRAARAFEDGEAIGFAVGEDGGGTFKPVCASIQRALAGAKNAAVGAHPQQTMAIVGDVADDVVRQSFAGANGGELTSAQPAQTAAKRADPKVAILFREERPDVVTGQSVGFPELRGLAVAPAAQTAAGHAEPDGPVAGLGDATNVGLIEFTGETFGSTILEPNESLLSADPERGIFPVEQGESSEGFVQRWWRGNEMVLLLVEHAAPPGPCPG